jgi:hypothetical protein
MWVVMAQGVRCAPAGAATGTGCSGLLALLVRVVAGGVASRDAAPVTACALDLPLCSRDGSTVGGCPVGAQPAELELLARGGHLEGRQSGRVNT